MLNSIDNNAVASLKGKHVLVTGGAGFIGSNLTEYLLKNNVRVTVLDNLSTGYRENISPFLSDENFRFIEGDITDYNTCIESLKGVDCISHQAALGSVPRSIEFPHNTHNVNATGFLNMLHAAKESGIKRMVYASSSSVYGNSKESPKVVGHEGEVLSPYAVTKQLNEEYSKVYQKLHKMEMIGLRYFNVFGPRQNPNGAYAAAVPKFIDKMINGELITINGDGEQTRDFTYVQNAIKANVLGLVCKDETSFGQAFNVACGDYFSLNQVIDSLKTNLTTIGLYNPNCEVVNGPERPGDVRDSLADITLSKSVLGYDTPTSFDEGIKELCAIIKKHAE